MRLHFSCQLTEFQRGLEIVERAVAKGDSALPLLSTIRLELLGGRLKLAATNLHIGCLAWVEVAVKEDSQEGAIAAPAKLLTDLVRTLADKKNGASGTEIEIMVVGETSTIRVRYLNGITQLQGVPADHFPPVPDARDGQYAVPLPVLPLKNAIKHVSVAVAHDESRPALACILVQVEADRVSFAAADGQRLAYDELPPPLSDQSEFGNILVPQWAMNELIGMLPGTGAVTMSLTPNRSQVLFYTDWFTISIVLVSGEFPNYRAMVPKERPLRLRLTTADFRRGVQLTRLFAGERQITRLTITNGHALKPASLTIASEQTELGVNLLTVPATVEGDDAVIAFNVKYLLEALQTVSTPEVLLEIGIADAAKIPAPAGFIRPVGAPGFHCFMSLKA